MLEFNKNVQFTVNGKKLSYKGKFKFYKLNKVT